MRFIQSCACAAAAVVSLSSYAVSAETIEEINGVNFLSSFNGKPVTGVTGQVTAKGPDGIWIRSTTPDDDERTSGSIYVFDRRFGRNLTVGDVIELNGRVTEYRQQPSYLYLTEITSPRLVEIVEPSTGDDVEALVIGKDTLSPPTQQYSVLDDGDVFKVPNNESLVSAENPELQPAEFGLDFWESLTGELVTIRKPTAVSRPNRFGDTWVVGDWKTTGRNRRGGLTMTDADANPEAILIGTPLNNASNPADTKLGDELEDITGIVTYAFGFFRILPLTPLSVVKSPKPDLPPPSKLTAGDDCSRLTFGVYNAENLAPNSTNLPGVARHIAEYLQSPTVVFLQEIQDNNGPTNDAVVDANQTLTTLISAISEFSDVPYEFLDISPVDDQDGGQPGGNIRVSYLYNSDVVRPRNPNPGSSTDRNEVLPGPELKFNPGRIEPQNTEAWTSSRKPLAAAFETLDGENVFFTVNVHFASKGGSSSLHGDPRPPVNGDVDVRQIQAEVTAAFIASILEEDPSAAIIAAGDFNEFSFVAPLETFVAESGLLDLDEVAKLKPEERYTYLFDMNSQQLDHMYVSESIAEKKVDYEHIHINTWASAGEEVSDHDPSLARLDVCSSGNNGGYYM